MKKFIAAALAVVPVIALASVLGTIALAVDFLGSKTINLPGYAGLDITVSDIAAKYGRRIESQYGTYNLVVGSPDATITFSKTVKLGNMGQDAGAADAGVAKPMSEMDGYYVYADDNTLYTIFVTTANAGGQYQESALNADTATIFKGAPPSVAKTGDGLNVAVWSAVAAAAAAGLIVTARRRRVVEQ